MPDVGIHRDVPSETYHSWPLCSSGMLHLLAESGMARVRWAMENPRPATPSLKLGQLVHAMILEPHKVEATFAVSADGRTKTGKQANATASASGKVLLSEDAFEQARAMAEAVRKHPIAAPLFEGAIDRELSLVFDFGPVRCKARIDALCPAVFVDLKTTSATNPRQFRRSFYQYGYDIQVAHYSLALERLGFGVLPPRIVTVETEPPYSVQVYTLSSSLFSLAAERHAELIRRWAAEFDKNEEAALIVLDAQEG